ncbi:MAG: hypothetical protein JXA79_05130 [Deltaproteobacteria bacterium]|nr:hypothetical protein [Deltaproteobacteria bacterium]
MARSDNQNANMTKEETEDLILTRLKLLLIMCMSYLEDCPMGVFRKNAVSNTVQSLKDLMDNQLTGSGGGLNIEENEVFLQRVRLLLIMAQSFSDSLPVGFYRKEAMKNNVKKIAGYLGYEIKLNPIIYLKAA